MRLYLESFREVNIDLPSIAMSILANIHLRIEYIRRIDIDI